MSDIVERLMEAETEELHGWEAVKLGQLLGEAADLIERQAAVIGAAWKNGLFLVRMLEVGLTEEEFTVGDLAKVQSSFEFFRALEAWLEE